jgi:hypothetical protein
MEPIDATLACDISFESLLEGDPPYFSAILAAGSVASISHYILGKQGLNRRLRGRSPECEDYGRQIQRYSTDRAPRRIKCLRRTCSRIVVYRGVRHAFIETFCANVCKHTYAHREERLGIYLRRETRSISCNGTKMGVVECDIVEIVIEHIVSNKGKGYLVSLLNLDEGS